MKRSNGIAPASERSVPLTRRGQGATTPVRSPMSAKRSTRPGSTPRTSVPTPVMARAAITGGGVTIGVRSPSGASLHPHLAHDPQVVAGGDGRVHGGDDRQRVGGPVAGVEHGSEHVELGDPATERRDAGQRGEEDRHQHGEARGVADQPAERGDLAAAGLAGDGDHDGERTEVREPVDQQVDDDGLQRRLTRLGGVAGEGERQRHEDEAALADARVGEHPHDVRLAQGDARCRPSSSTPRAPRSAGRRRRRHRGRPGTRRGSGPTNPAAFDATDRNAVTGVGAPS